MFLSAFLPIMSLWLGEVWNKRVFTVQSERLSLSAQLRIYESVEDQMELIDAGSVFFVRVYDKTRFIPRTWKKVGSEIHPHPLQTNYAA